MTDTNAFALPHSTFNSFLFAEIGVEASGMPLSVLSAFARLGMDPWQEAQRLARLPGHVAINSLAGIVTTALHRPIIEATVIAGRLVKLLPGGREVPADVAPARSPSSKNRYVVQRATAIGLIVLALAGLVIGVAKYRGVTSDNLAQATSSLETASSPASPAKTKVPISD